VHSQNTRDIATNLDKHRSQDGKGEHRADWDDTSRHSARWDWADRGIANFDIGCWSKQQQARRPISGEPSRRGCASRGFFCHLMPKCFIACSASKLTSLGSIQAHARICMLGGAFRRKGRAE
jgi:hypothetical protein